MLIPLLYLASDVLPSRVESELVYIDFALVQRTGVGLGGGSGAAETGVVRASARYTAWIHVPQANGDATTHTTLVRTRRFAQICNFHLIFSLARLAIDGYNSISFADGRYRRAQLGSPWSHT